MHKYSEAELKVLRNFVDDDDLREPEEGEPVLADATMLHVGLDLVIEALIEAKRDAYRRIERLENELEMTGNRWCCGNDHPSFDVRRYGKDGCPMCALERENAGLRRMVDDFEQELLALRG